MLVIMGTLSAVIFLLISPIGLLAGGLLYLIFALFFVFFLIGIGILMMLSWRRDVRYERHDDDPHYIDSPRNSRYHEKNRER